MLDRPRSEVLPTPFASFPFTSPPVRHRVPSGSAGALLQNCLQSINPTTSLLYPLRTRPSKATEITSLRSAIRLRSGSTSERVIMQQAVDIRSYPFLLHSVFSAFYRGRNESLIFFTECCAVLFENSRLFKDSPRIPRS